MSELNLPGLSIKTSDKTIWSVQAPEEGYWLRALSDEALMKELELRGHPFLPTARALVEAVERYVEPKKGEPYMHRTALLRIKNQLKERICGPGQERNLVYIQTKAGKGD